MNIEAGNKFAERLGADDAPWMNTPGRPCDKGDPEPTPRSWGNGIDAEFFDAAADLHVDAKKKPPGWAKEKCKGCPVINKCLQYALDNREEWGVWGGATATERAAMRRTGAA